MIAAGIRTSIIASILICLCALYALSGHIEAAQNNSGQSQPADHFKLIVKIVGLDYSVGNVKVCVISPDGTTATR
ncbi:MAG TPA: hypothetical protein VE089_01755 [Nitrososphaeraceae archaeon]|nr:hypothetical protein [Nitrososphaeraceae archaeon]